jgi:hypothetical protein
LNIFEVKNSSKLNDAQTFALLPICFTCEKIISDESCEETCSIQTLEH